MCSIAGSEAEHYYLKYPTCGAYVDMRDLGQVLEEDEWPMPHPVRDRAQ